MTFLSHILSAAPAERIGWTLLHSLWQFALLAVLLAGVLEVLRRRSANSRYLVGCLALAAMLAAGATTFCLLPAASPPTAEPVAAAVELPAASVPTPTADVFPRADSAVADRSPPPDAAMSIPAEPPATDATAEAASAPFLSRIGEALSPWLPWITVLWLSGVVLLSLRNLVGWIGVQRLRRVGTAPVCQELADRARTLIGRMKISRPVRVLQSTLVEIPIVVGWLTPVILLPASILAELSPQQLEAILAHELAHIRRHDYLVNLLQTVAETLLFYHPAVWWVSRRIRVEREHCCDDAAVRVCGDNTGLGEALTLLEVSRLAPMAAVAASGSRSGGTLHRVRRLLDPKTESIGFSKASAAVVVFALLGVTVMLGWGRRATAENTPATNREAAVSTDNGSAKNAASRRHIAGRVIDDSGKPVAGALLEWGYINDPPEKWQRTTTDAEGRYRLDLREYGVDYRLGVSAPGKTPQWRFFVSTEYTRNATIRDEDAVPPELASFRLKSGHRIAGVVVDEKKRPIAGVQVEAKTTAGQGASSWYQPRQPMPIPGRGSTKIRTDSAGRFAFDDLPDEAVTLKATAPHRHANAGNYAVDCYEQRIVMSGSGRAGIVRGQVLDQQTGKPVREFRLMLRYDPKPHQFTTTDGHFKLDGDFTEGAMQTLYIYSKNYGPVEVQILALPLGSDDRPTLVLPRRGCPLLGQLVDAQRGKPVANVPVMYAVPSKEKNSSHYIEWSDWSKYVDGYGSFDAVQRTTTDENGTFWFSESTNRPEGTLLVFAPGYERLILSPEQLPARDSAGGMRIMIQPEATVSGVLLSGGKPLADAKVSVWRPKSSTTDIEETFERVSTDSQGRFRIGRLAPGTYELHRWISPSRSASMPQTLRAVTVGTGEQIALEPITVGELSPKSKEELRGSKELPHAADRATQPSTPRDPSEGLITRGREASEQVARQKPAWGKAVKGVQVGISRLGDKDKYQAGQRVPLEFYIRNASDKPLSVLFPLEFYNAGHTPTVYDAKGNTVGVNCVSFRGLTAEYRETLSPGAVLVCRHIELGIGGEKPCIDPTVGRYSLEQRETICLMGLTGNTLWDTLALTTGRINFEIVDKTAETETSEKDVGTATKTSTAVSAARKEHCYAGEVRVVDDETGKPIEKFSEQGRLPDLPNSPGDIRWGGEGTSLGGYRDGRLSVGWEYVGEGRVEFRILADGYLPYHVRIPLEKDGLIKLTTVRMKRGGSLHGRVLDHEGKPVGDARVFFRGPRSLRIENGRANTNGAGSNAAVTDANGRFTITGGGKESTQVVVLAPHLMAWTVPAPKEGLNEELTIRLPKPATLRIVVDLPGAVQGNEQQIVEQPGRGPRVAPAGKDVSFRLEMMTWEMPGWKESGNFTETRTTANPGEVVFENLTPGIYDFSRTKMLCLGDRGQGAMCDRQLHVTLLHGESKTIRLVRKRGQRVAGEIHGLPEHVPGVFITVRPAAVSGDPHRSDEWKLPEYDALTCENNKHFLTGLLEPGRYKIVAEGYRPEPRTGAWHSGWRMPESVGTALVTVEDDAPANPKKPAPHVTIEMKPRDQQPIGKDQGKAKLDSVADLPEFHDMDLSVTEKSLQRMIAANGLRNICTEDRQSKQYHVFRKDGENVTITFKDGKCVGVQRMRKEAAYADRLFNGLGKVARSLQVTLRAEKKLWHAGEDLALKADVRNAGKEDVPIYIDGNNSWQIELDGKWYWSDARTTGHAVLVAPAERIRDISVPPTWTRPLGWFHVPDEVWGEHSAAGKRLVLEPGRHTIRVAVVPVMDSGPYGYKPPIPSTSDKSVRLAMPIQATPGKPVRAVSNAIEIEVEPSPPPGPVADFVVGIRPVPPAVH